MNSTTSSIENATNEFDKEFNRSFNSKFHTEFNNEFNKAFNRDFHREVNREFVRCFNVELMTHNSTLSSLVSSCGGAYVISKRTVRVSCWDNRFFRRY